MINNIPDPEDFRQSGIMFLNLAWDQFFNLVFDIGGTGTLYSYATEELKQDLQKHWNIAKRLLITSLALAQQGTELILKGAISEVSPFILLGEPRNWSKQGTKKM
jgi:hypothetical protein